MKNTISQLILLGCLLILLLTACSGSSPRSLKPSPDWSRGTELGDNAAGSIGVAIDGAGERVHLVWTVEKDGKLDIQYTQLSNTGEVVLSHEVDLPVGYAISPRLVPAAGGQLHLFWSERGGSQEKWELYSRLLASDGQPAGDITAISVDDSGVDDFTAISDGQGGAWVIWSGFQEGLYLAHLLANGFLESSPMQVADVGENPTLSTGPDGSVHLAWQSGNSFYYSWLEGNQGAPDEPVRVADQQLNVSTSLAGPALGVTGDRLYLFWSIFSQSGNQAGTAQASYVSFPVGEPGYSAAENVYTWIDEEQPYASYESGYGLTRLAEPAPASASSEYVHQPTAASARGDEVAVALATYQELRRDMVPQLAVAIFKDGQFIGYEMAAKTNSNSTDPALAADEAGNLHLAWREGASGRKIYYATTQPAARQNLDRTTPGDLIDAVLTGGLEALIGLMFFPWIGFGWLLPGGLVVGLWKFFHDHDNLNEDLASWFFALLAFAIYQATKVITLPTMVSYVPFSAWIPVSESLELPLRIAVPALILVADVLVAEFVRRRRSASALAYYLALAGTDVFLTLIIYGVNFLGVY